MFKYVLFQGIIIEVPFAPFFLTQILGHGSHSTYSSLDELPSLDPDLAKNLSYTKVQNMIMSFHRLIKYTVKPMLNRQPTEWQKVAVENRWFSIQMTT